MKDWEKLGLIIFIIGMFGAQNHRDDNTFWFAILIILIGAWMFVGYNFMRKATADNTDFKTASTKLKHS